MGDLWLFIPVGIVAAVAGIMVVISRKAVYSALWLVLNLFCVAFFYLSLNAEFLAAVQIILYAGAIVVLFLFVITLLNPRAEEGPDRLRVEVPVAFALALLLMAEVLVALNSGLGGIRAGQVGFPPPTVPWTDNVRAIGSLLFTDFLLPFEATTLLLMVALVGATVLAKGRLQTRPKRRPKATGLEVYRPEYAGRSETSQGEIGIGTAIGVARKTLTDSPENTEVLNQDGAPNTNR